MENISLDRLLFNLRVINIKNNVFVLLIGEKEPK